MNADSPTISSATYIERLQQAVRVMEGLSDTERADFDIHVFAVRRENRIYKCIAGFCGFDPWFQAQGFSATPADIEEKPACTGDVTLLPEIFFGTDRPFYRGYYSVPYDQDVTVDDGIAALKRSIESFEAMRSNAAAVTA